ncbi:hypothetical protein CN558_28300 [Bacillus wiedmannii]|uniref:Uncharacterized protein n=1 Tax=Bacillus wiedmannii TaxID=1890302 RepID=A0A2C5Q0A4_9BACI|nr:hypothetical protein CN609_10630 [Bacillus wiedmannii]PEL94426.1 hypothetical protein CN626_02460 [Bacillus wiedmannii]PEM81613.1 hypothetical protein CN627_28145 [Bacillus wiedmannii]PEO79582.1 hypothetical protein CN558_28300 [Bacillus wiedmannii]PHG63722.1 hypothetical protein COI65_07780 [Bacillus wiedmannii]
MNVAWHKPTCLLPYTCTDCSLKTEDMRLVAEKCCNQPHIFNVLAPHVCRSCENQAKVGNVVSQRTRYLCFHCRDYGQSMLR